MVTNQYNVSPRILECLPPLVNEHQHGKVHLIKSTNKAALGQAVHQDRSLSPTPARYIILKSADLCERPMK